MARLYFDKLQFVQVRLHNEIKWKIIYRLQEEKLKLFWQLKRQRINRVNVATSETS